MAVACGAGVMGSLGGAVNSLPVFALFFLITMIAGLSVLVRGGILIFKGWQSLPMKYRTVSPSSTWLLLVPIYNLYQIFVSTVGLSRQTNRAFKDRNQSGIAPEGLAMAVSIAWVVGTVGPLVFTQIWLLYSFFVAQIVLAGLWIIEQARATNTLNGHTVAAEDFKPWWFGTVGAGGLAVLIAVVSGVAESAAKAAPVPPDVTMPGPILDDGGSRDYAPQAQPQPYPRSQNSGWQYTDQPRQPAGNSGFSNTQNSGPKTCTSCDGSGTGPFSCTHCDGTGKSGTGSFKCSFCKGRGFPPCSRCNGTGQTRSSW
ncbi:MAG: hypothetical protein M5U26_13245 [Planctomycetota bacterium]|nr:hypothetical protein [Planctomycetota bacterium]